MMKRKIAIFGGSFNPPHKGHSAVISLIDEKTDCDEIWILPSASRRDKKISVSGTNRIEMLEMMLKDLPRKSKKLIQVVDHESKKSTLSATIDTKQELEKLYPNYEFYFVCGSDVVPDIMTKWVRGDELFTYAHFILIDLPERIPLKNSMLPPHSTVLTMKKPEKISSTLVRSCVDNQRELRKYVSPTVADFILEKRLYK